MGDYQVLKDILSLVREDLSEVGPENGVGYTMPDGKHHIFIYIDVIHDEKVFVLEPNRVEDGAHEPFTGNTYIANFEDSTELLLGCEWCIKQFEDDLELQLGISSEESGVNVAFSPEDEKQISEEYKRKGDKELYDGSFKYWSNACGELHHHGEYDITEEELPEPLKRAYNELWSEGYSCLCYLVETADGYGVALINEYDEYTASVKECTMDELFSAVLADKEKVMGSPLFQKAKVFAGDYTGFEECHELVVVFPADTPFEEFDASAQQLGLMLYDSPPIIKGSVALSDAIKDAEEQKGEPDSKTTINRGNNHEL